MGEDFGEYEFRELHTSMKVFLAWRKIVLMVITFAKDNWPNALYSLSTLNPQLSNITVTNDLVYSVNPAND